MRYQYSYLHRVTVASSNLPANSPPAIARFKNKADRKVWVDLDVASFGSTTLSDLLSHREAVQVVSECA